MRRNVSETLDGPSGVTGRRSSELRDQDFQRALGLPAASLCGEGPLTFLTREMASGSLRAGRDAAAVLGMGKAISLDDPY